MAFTGKGGRGGNGVVIIRLPFIGYLSAGSAGLIAIKNSVKPADMPGYCQSACWEPCLCAHSLGREIQSPYCPVGTYLYNASLCSTCPKNTYRDMTAQGQQQCTACRNGFVTRGPGASSSLACKNWCAVRKEKGTTTVDTFPKIGNLAGSNFTADLLQTMGK